MPGAPGYFHIGKAKQTIIQMKDIIRFALATLGMEANVRVALSSEAETAGIFAKHDLPIPGAHFAKHSSRKSTTVAISKSGQGDREQKQPVS
jgi:hypothetical protein